jgi:RNA polymerase sigma factor (sigma-70 family)
LSNSYSVTKEEAGVPEQQTDKDELLLGLETTSLFNRYGQAIFGYVRLHTRSREEIKDITLEVFQIALEHDNLSWLNEAEQIIWLRRVASNKIVDRYRRATRHPEVALETISETVCENESSDPEHLAVQQEAHSHLHQVIQTLPTLQQQILRLRYGDRLSFAEIGRLLGKKETTVRKHHSRLLARLRVLYHHQEGE